MNCIILEGIGLWIAVILVVLLLTVLLVSLLCVVWSDKKITSTSSSATATTVWSICVNWEMSDEEYLHYANPMKAMISVNRLHRAKVEKAFEGTGLHRAQHRTLMVLSRNEYESQVELAKALEVSTATLAVSLKKLERDGYIQKTAKAEDSRAKFVTLTEKGKEVVEMSRTIFGKIDDQAVQGFSEEDLILFRKYLKRVYENLLAIEKEMEE